MIPKAGRQELVDQLHTTHLSFQGMRNLARNKFFWPGMSSALEKKYYSCQDCKINSVSNHDKTIQVVPEGLNMLAPSEQVSMDFCTYLKQDIMMLKDRVSGLIWPRATSTP